MILDSIQYKVFGPGNISTAAGVTYQTCFGVKKEGIGLKIVPATQTLTTETGDVTTYTRKSEKPGSLDASTWIQKEVESRLAGVIYRAHFEVGPLVPVGAMYSVTVFGETVTYTAVLSDTPTIVKAQLKSLIDANTYSKSVSTTYDSSNRLVVFFGDPVESATAEVQNSTTVLYQSGAYLTYNGDDYLIGNANSTTIYPPTPPIAASYNLADLELMPLGLKLHISEAGYTETVYNETASGTTLINGFVTYSYNPGINEVMIDEPNNTLIFGNEFGTQETITILHLR